MSRPMFWGLIVTFDLHKKGCLKIIDTFCGRHTISFLAYGSTRYSSGTLVHRRYHGF